MREDGCATGILAVFWTRRFLLGLRLVRAFLVALAQPPLSLSLSTRFCFGPAHYLL
jgi:hypothetical protein